MGAVCKGGERVKWGHFSSGLGVCDEDYKSQVSAGHGGGAQARREQGYTAILRGTDPLRVTGMSLPYGPPVRKLRAGDTDITGLRCVNYDCHPRNVIPSLQAKTPL